MPHWARMDGSSRCSDPHNPHDINGFCFHKVGRHKNKGPKNPQPPKKTKKHCINGALKKVFETCQSSYLFYEYKNKTADLTSVLFEIKIRNIRKTPASLFDIIHGQTFILTRQQVTVVNEILKNDQKFGLFLSEKGVPLQSKINLVRRQLDLMCGFQVDFDSKLFYSKTDLETILHDLLTDNNN